MPKDHYVIIGNGPAGNHAAVTLRQKAGNAKITILSDECLPFYYKPRLTAFIADEITRDELVVKKPAFYEEHDIRIRLGQTVERIDPEKKMLFLEHMETIQYTGLVIASGSRQRLLPNMEKYAGCLKFITSYADVIETKEHIKTAKEFFIFGGDFVGFKFINLLRSMEKNVTVLIYPNAFWPYNLNKDMLESIYKNLAKLGVTALIKDDIAAINPDQDAFLITTGKGFEISADMIFSFNGLVPNIGFLKSSGIDTDYGVLVDEYLKTSVADIYACGSCAQIYNPDIKTYTATIGWPNAAAQGELAALNLLGDQSKVKSVGRRYFDMEGVMIKTTWWEDISEEM